MKPISNYSKNQPRELFAWAMYDWANSVYSLVIATAIFPIYYYAVVPENLDFEYFVLKNVSVHSYSISFAYLLIVLIGPLLGGIADARGLKKTFLMAACYVGATSCAALYFFTKDHAFLGIGLFTTATYCFAQSDMFYNAFLPDVATPDRFDKLSAKGYSLGYLGSSILLILALILIQLHEKLGIDEGRVTRFSFLLTGLWWAGFGTFTFSRLRERRADHFHEKKNIFGRGFAELFSTYREIRSMRLVKRFLLSFLFYNMGVQTVMYMATDFGTYELHLPTGDLILALLLIQFVGIAGAYLFAQLSLRKGNTWSLRLAVVSWVLICVGAYFTHSATEFYVLGALVGLVMGGIQSMSRATYSKLIPSNEHKNASFFSFYSVVDKLAIIVGTFLFGWLYEWTASMRLSVVFLIVFFLLGLLLLPRLSEK